MFNCFDGHDIVAALTKLLAGRIEDESVLIVAVVAELFVLNLFVLEELADLEGGGFVEIDFDLSVLVQRHDLEGSVGEVSESEVACFSLFDVGIRQNPSLQFHYPYVSG
jgi:hypothetical protein